MFAGRARTQEIDTSNNDRLLWLRRSSSTIRSIPGIGAVLAVRTRWRQVQAGARLQVALALAAVALWLAGIPEIDLGRMNDLGLISVLPAWMLAAPILLTGSFALGLRSPEASSRWLALCVVIFVLMLYGLPVMVEAVPRIAVTWLHTGFIEYVMRTGAFAPLLDARFDWPGFFALGALVTQLCGFGNALQIAAWAPVYLNLLYAAPLLLIFRSATTDQRHVWAAVWLFYLTNWVGQDYFSPQGLNYFLYLVILAVVLTWLRLPGPQARVAETDRFRRSGALATLADVRRWLAQDQVPSRVSLPWQRAGLIVVLLVVFAAVTSSHQLTPFFTLAALIALASLRRVDLVGLPALFAVMIAAWLTYVAAPFLAGHLTELVTEVGQLGGTVSSNVVSRFAGSAEHQFVVTLRVVFALALWGTAGVGWLRRAITSRPDLSMAVLAVAPFPLAALQAYGGELVLRLFLFSLPFMCFFAVSLLFHARPWRAAAMPVANASRPPSLRAIAAIGLSVVVSVTFLIVRYGNERVDYMTQPEVEAIAYLYRVAPAGSLLAAASSNLPWKYQDVEQYDYIPVTDEVLANVDVLVGLMQQSKDRDAFLILTKSEEAYAETFAGVTPGAWGEFVARAEASPRLRLLYANPDAEVFELVR
jgi:hypothetical protein